MSELLNDAVDALPLVHTQRLSGCLYSTWPRLLWQGLFNRYREHGDLANMDNMLLDYDNCQAFFNDAVGDEGAFLWGIYDGHYSTTWIPSSAWWGGDPFNNAQLCDHDHLYIVAVRDQTITIREMPSSR